MQIQSIITVVTALITLSIAFPTANRIDLESRNIIEVCIYLTFQLHSLVNESEIGTYTGRGQER
jgi:hypothetical protein